MVEKWEILVDYTSSATDTKVYTPCFAGKIVCSANSETLVIPIRYRNNAVAFLFVVSVGLWFM